MPAVPKIEGIFREMEQQVGAFCYHFWTHAIPRLGRYQKKDSGDPLVQVKDLHDRQRIIKTLKAIEGYMMSSSIAMGIIQLLCLRYQDDIHVPSFRYLRTLSHGVMSEASMMAYLRQNLSRFMALQGDLTITKIISSKQVALETEDIDRLIS